MKRLRSHFRRKLFVLWDSSERNNTSARRPIGRSAQCPRGQRAIFGLHINDIDYPQAHFLSRIPCARVKLFSSLLGAIRSKAFSKITTGCFEAQARLAASALFFPGTGAMAVSGCAAAVANGSAEPPGSGTHSAIASGNSVKVAFGAGSRRASSCDCVAAGNSAGALDASLKTSLEQSSVASRKRASRRSSESCGEGAGSRRGGTPALDSAARRCSIMQRASHASPPDSMQSSINCMICLRRFATRFSRESSNASIDCVEEPDKYFKGELASAMSNGPCGLRAAPQRAKRAGDRHDTV